MLLACICVGAPSVVPLLDAGGAETRAHVESSHDPGRCLRLHDHAACVQIVKSAPIPGAAWLPPGSSSSPADRGLDARRVPADRPAASPPRARAPPGSLS